MDIPELSDNQSHTWIKEGEKFALIGLEVKLERDVQIPFTELAPDHWVMANVRFPMPALWREWLGTIRADELKDYNLFLISKMPSKRPEVLDAENQILTRRVSNFYTGLLLSSNFAPSHHPVMLPALKSKMRSMSARRPISKRRSLMECATIQKCDGRKS
jgi:hypothetical protein